jgi:uncharacterized protein YecE (DUF72 family)
VDGRGIDEPTGAGDYVGCAAPARVPGSVASPNRANAPGRPCPAVGRYWIGCSGWAYDDWIGPFYPTGTPPGDFLSCYARVFRTVEVDSSFYRAPGPFLVRRWAERTPDGFRFALKMPRDVTHETGPASIHDVVDPFLASLEPLRARGKLGPVVLQFPPSFRATTGTARLERLLDAVPREYALAVELRHRSWWTETTRSLLTGRRAALVWSVVPETRPPPWVTGDFLYARFIGDRALTEFGRIQRDKRPEIVAMKTLFEHEGRPVDSVFAFANNHFMGFGPGTAAVIAEVLGEPRPDLGAAGRPAGQSRLEVGPDE